MVFLKAVDPQKCTCGLSGCRVKPRARCLGGVWEVYSSAGVFSSFVEVFCPGVQVFCPGVQVFCPGVQVFCPGVQVFCSGVQVFCSGVQVLCWAFVTQANFGFFSSLVSYLGHFLLRPMSFRPIFC